MGECSWELRGSSYLASVCMYGILCFFRLAPSLSWCIWGFQWAVPWLGRCIRYLSFANVLSNAISGWMFVTPDMKIGGGFGSVLCLFVCFLHLIDWGRNKSVGGKNGSSEPVVVFIFIQNFLFFRFSTSFSADCFPWLFCWLWVYWSSNRVLGLGLAGVQYWFL